MNTQIVKPNEDSVKKAGEILRCGGIVAFPTDTVYGLGAVYTDVSAVMKIFEAKGRDEGKPLSILISDISQVDELAREIPENAKKLMRAFWPGALTVIVKKSESVPACVTAGGDTVGIRMPSSETAREIIECAGSPLAAPSANISGKRSAASGDDVREDLFGRIDMIIDGGRCDIGVSSTVVDLTEGKIRILREGTISRQEISKVCDAQPL